MKVVSPKEMAQLEALAYQEGSSEFDFMEEAGSGVALVAHEYAEKHQLDRRIVLLCGKGNNAGDAYVAGRDLLHLDYDVVAYQLYPISDCSTLCQQNYYQFLNDGGRIKEIEHIEEMTFSHCGLIVDGIFGTGFHGQTSGDVARIIRKANESRVPIIAVDIPSGLNGETGQVEGDAIVATVTGFLGLPKTGFFLNQGWDHVGKLVYVNFGLPLKYTEAASSDFIMLDPDLLRPLIPPLKRSRHKYEAGHVIGLAGSQKMAGAAMLASHSAIASGAGIIHLLYPAGMEIQLAAAPYELIKIPFEDNNTNEIIEIMNKANATFIGPGLGRAPETYKLLRTVIPKLNKPCVLDADALAFLAEEEISLPQNCILTPHMGEYKRLLHSDTLNLNLEFVKQCQEYAQKKNITLVLKGAPTYIFHPNAPILVNPRGDPGMATAGSGDVLTGLLASLLAQGLTPYDAAALGVYLHGVAGEWAAETLTSYCMTASDIINFLPDAFHSKTWTKWQD